MPDGDGVEHRPHLGELRFDVDDATFEYFPAGHDIAAPVIANLWGYEFRKDASTQSHPRLRRVAMWVRWMDDVRRVFGALHWDDGTDLDELDRAALAGEVTDGDDPRFGGAVFVDVHDVGCLVCHNSNLVASPDPVMPMARPPRLRGRRLSRTCPTCRSDGYIAHVEVLT